MADDTRSGSRSRRPRPSASRKDQPQEDVTRCVCKKQAVNLDVMMVQCDKCDVWQHVPCMQLNPSRLPNEYLCELCAPQNHERLLANLKKRQASAAGLSEPTPKKRTTMNSLISEITDPDVSSVKLEAGMLAPESAELAGGDSAAASSSRRAVNGAGVASSMPSTPSFSAAVNGKSRRDDGRAQDSLAPSPSFASASGGSASRDRSRKESSRRARDATDDAPDDFSPRGRRYDDGGYSQDESPDGSPAAERAVFRRDTRRTSSRGRAFHKDMTVADMLKRTRAMLQYLRRSRRDLTQGGRQYDEFEENERSKTPTGSESECLQRIAELEGRVVKFQQSYSSRGRSSESLAASPSPSPTATIAQ